MICSGHGSTRSLPSTMPWSGWRGRLTGASWSGPSAHNPSDEALCERWVQNPYFQFYCGEEFFQHELTFERSSLTRWRQRIGKEQSAGRRQDRRGQTGRET
ncbi:mobile element protein [Bosea sp. BIWAKO-01]|nr:mobile element protein [Bosea sp. BIWAKO-01]